MAAARRRIRVKPSIFGVRVCPGLSRPAPGVLAAVLTVLLSFAISGCAAGTAAGSGFGSAKNVATHKTVPGRKYAHYPRTVVGLGDSVMAGTACGCSGPVTGYVRAMQRRSGRRVLGTNRGRGGATTMSLLTDLRNPTTQGDITRARAVLVIIGANDLAPQHQRWIDDGCPASCYQPAVTAMGQRVRKVLTIVQHLRTHSRGPVLIADYWNVFRDGAVARNAGGQMLITWSRAVSRSANRAICSAARRTSAICVDTYVPFLGNDHDPTDLLAPDGDHPNIRGMRLLVRQLVKATPSGVFF